MQCARTVGTSKDVSDDRKEETLLCSWLYNWRNVLSAFQTSVEVETSMLPIRPQLSRLLDIVAWRSRRVLSISKGDVIQSSQNIQSILKLIGEDSSEEQFSRWLCSSIDQIHETYPSSRIATSSKEIYQKNASTLNAISVELEKERRQGVARFELNTDNELLILLRYNRYIRVAFIYRLLTIDMNIPMKDTSNRIVHLTRKTNDWPKKCETDVFRESHTHTHREVSRSLF